MANIFHYTAVLQELSSALQYTLQAQDWKLGMGEAGVASAADKLRRERGNLQAALSAIRGSFITLQQRADDLRLEIMPIEQQVLDDVTPSVVRTLQQSTDSHLPPELQSPEGENA